MVAISIKNDKRYMENKINDNDDTIESDIKDKIHKIIHKRVFTC